MPISHVYLSPHLDDAALSCGGTIFQQTQAGQRALVVNVFAGAPDPGKLPAFAQEKHVVWGNPEDVIATRRAEDEAALAILGADAVYWEYGDAIYRVDGDRALYPSEAGIFGDVDPTEHHLPAGLADRVEAIVDRASNAVCYVPLGVGHHVDHLIARDVGRLLLRRGRSVAFYEDFPYVWWNLTHHPINSEANRRSRLGLGHQPVPTTSFPPPALKELGDWEAHTRAIDIEPKIRAVACYSAQVEDLFAGEEAMAGAVSEYAKTVGGDHDAERFWYPRNMRV